jgi:hypothetical protein
VFYCFLFLAEYYLSGKTVFRRTVSGAVNNLLVFIPPNRLRCTFSAEPVWEIVWCRAWRKIRNSNDDKDAGIRLSKASAKEVPITQHRCHLFAPKAMASASMIGVLPILFAPKRTPCLGREMTAF